MTKLNDISNLTLKNITKTIALAVEMRDLIIDIRKKFQFSAEDMKSFADFWDNRDPDFYYEEKPTLDKWLEYWIKSSQVNNDKSPKE